MPADPRVDKYIANAPPFAQPILRHLRELVHQGCPDVVEDIKWSRPMFLYRDKILYGMAAFTAHCGFHFWHPEITKKLEGKGYQTEKSSGSLGRLTQLGDLPPDKELLAYIKESRKLLDEHPSSLRSRKPSGQPKPAAEIPADLTAQLAKNKAAAKAFEAFSGSHRREYIEWITEAKRDETRQKRIATTIQWLAEGKPRNWKYMNS